METCPEHSAHREHFKRLDQRVLQLEEDDKEIVRFTERITVLVDKYDEQLDDHDARLTALEAVPANRWNAAMQYVFTAAAGTVLGIVLSHIGL